MKLTHIAAQFIRKLFPASTAKARLTKDYYIRCPHCRTLYALYSHVKWDTLLAVKCGICTNHFNGLENKSKPDSKIKIPKTINPFQARLSTRRAQLQLPSPYMGDILALDPMPLDPVPFDPTPAAKIIPDVIPDILSLPPEMPDEISKKTSKWGWITFGVGVILATNVLLVSVLWTNQEQFAQNALMRPWLELACNYLDCHLAPYQDPSKIIVQQHQLIPDPSNPNHLELHALIQNSSPFAQSLPTLLVNIDDLQGKLVETVTFKPTEYAPSNPGVLLEPGQTLHISVVITDKTPDIFSYELHFI